MVNGVGFDYGNGYGSGVGKLKGKLDTLVSSMNISYKCYLLSSII